MMLDEARLDTLKEIINVGVGRSAAMLNAMLDTPIRLKVPKLVLTTVAELGQQFGMSEDDPIASVGLKFDGSFSGIASLAFPPASASILVSALTGDPSEEEDLDELRIGTLSEVGNMVVNGVLGSMANMLEEQLTYSIPSFSENSIGRLFATSGQQATQAVLAAQTEFEVVDMCIRGDILLLFEVGSFDRLMAAVDALNEGVSPCQSPRP